MIGAFVWAQLRLLGATCCCSGREHAMEGCEAWLAFAPTGSVSTVSREEGRCPGPQSALLRQGFVEAPNACWGVLGPAVPTYLWFLNVVKPTGAWGSVRRRWPASLAGGGGAWATTKAPSYRGLARSARPRFAERALLCSPCRCDFKAFSVQRPQVRSVRISIIHTPKYGQAVGFTASRPQAVT